MIIILNRTAVLKIDVFIFFFSRYLRDQIILDIKSSNVKKKDASLNSKLQNFLFKVCIYALQYKNYLLLCS